MSKTIDEIIDEVLVLHALNCHYKSWSSKDEARKVIKDIIAKEVHNTKIETVKKCNSSGKKSICSICKEPGSYESATGGTECIICSIKLPF